MYLTILVTLQNKFWLYKSSFVQVCKILHFNIACSTISFVSGFKILYIFGTYLEPFLMQQHLIHVIMVFIFVLYTVACGVIIVNTCHYPRYRYTLTLPSHLQVRFLLVHTYSLFLSIFFIVGAYLATFPFFAYSWLFLFGSCDLEYFYLRANVVLFSYLSLY